MGESPSQSPLWSAKVSSISGYLGDNYVAEKKDEVRTKKHTRELDADCVSSCRLEMCSMFNQPVVGVGREGISNPQKTLCLDIQH